MFIVRKPSKAPLNRLEEHRDLHPLDPQDSHLEVFPDTAGSKFKAQTEAGAEARTFDRSALPESGTTTRSPPNPLVIAPIEPGQLAASTSSDASFSGLVKSRIRLTR